MCSKVFTSFECRSDPDLSGFPRQDKPGSGRFTGRFGSFPAGGTAMSHGLSSLIFRFPPNFVRQLSTKARRNCSNIGVAQIVAASWSNNSGSVNPAVLAATAVDAADTVSVPVSSVELPTGDDLAVCENVGLELENLPDLKEAAFLSYDGSLAIHAGMF